MTDADRGSRFFAAWAMVVALLAATATTGARANLLKDGGFETPVIGTATFLDIVVGAEPAGFDWTVTTNGVDIISQGVLGQTAALFEGGQALDLVGVGNTGGLAQSFASSVGQHYTLSLAYSNNPFSGTSASAHVAISDGALALWSADITHAGALPANLFWNRLTADFVGNGHLLTLSFLNTMGGNNGGIYLDAVSVDLAAVPEPQTLPLLVIGIAGVAGGVVRQRRQALAGEGR